jgi:hypothetical protein
MNFTDKITAHILANNLNQTDIPVLFTQYPSFGNLSKVEIEQIAIKNINNLLVTKQELDSELLKTLLNTDSISRANKLSLFCLYFNAENEDEINDFLEILELSELNKVFGSIRGGRPKVTKNAETEVLLNAFKAVNIISEYQTDDQNPNKFIITRSHI